jgi:hypothetical protein
MKRTRRVTGKKSGIMAQHLLSVYGLEYPTKPKKQCAALKKYVARASEGMREKNDKLMYSTLLEFSVETKINNLHSRVSKLLTDDSEVSVPPWESTACAVCGKDNASMCSGCMLGRDPTVYCSKACQKSHWSDHKPECKEKTRPWTSEELAKAVGMVIKKQWQRSDITTMTMTPVPILDIADAAARLFNCVCIYLLKTDEFGAEKLVAAPMVSNLASLPNDHNDFMAAFTKDLASQIAVGHDTVITCHLDTYMENYRDWKATNTRFEIS